MAKKDKVLIVSGTIDGRWTFSLPENAAVSDFAVWDGVTRIPGVILERRRAREIYEDLRAQAIDPGLLEQGQGDARLYLVLDPRAF